MGFISKRGALGAVLTIATTVGCVHNTTQPSPNCLQAAQCVAAIDKHSTVALLLAERETLCNLPTRERQQQASYQQDSSKYALFKALLIRSCGPEREAEHVERITGFLGKQPLSDAEQGLLKMLSAHQEHISKLQKQADTLRRELESTIEGISEIEAQINQQQLPREDS